MSRVVLICIIFAAYVYLMIHIAEGLSTVRHNVQEIIETNNRLQ